MEKYSGEGAQKKPAQWAHRSYFEPTPLQDTKVQIKSEKRTQNSGNFSRKIELRIYGEIAIFCAVTCAHYAGRTQRRVGLKMLLIYAFIIRTYSQLQDQLHKKLDVTRHKSTFRIYVTLNHEASV